MIISIGDEDGMVTATINGREVRVSDKLTVLEAAREAGIYIPALCYYRWLEPYGGCRLCIVEIEGIRDFPTSCTTRITEGMKIKTDTPKLRELRKGIFEMIKLASRRGEKVTKALITDIVPPGVIYGDFHFAESPTIILTNCAVNPICKVPELKVSAVRVEKVSA